MLGSSGPIRSGCQRLVRPRLCAARRHLSTGLKASCTFDELATSTALDPAAIDGAKAIFAVNTASLCGYTPQLGQMQQLHERYQADGLVVVAVPSNDFGEQEPWEEAEVKAQKKKPLI